MIYTLTLNPAVDYFIEINGKLMKEEVNRGKNEVYKAAGKGLNVSRDLSIMGIRSKAVAVLGGFTGAYIREVFSEDPNIELIPVHVPGNNRINVKMHGSGSFFAINGEGPEAGAAAKAQILYILSGTDEKDACVISGSLMRGFDEGFVKEICDSLHSRKTKAVIDMEKISAATLAQCQPDLIKPNLYELKKLLSLPEDISPLSALEEAKKAGLSHVLLSLGKEGALLMLDDRICRMTHPHTDLVNKVGAGDAMLAAYIGKIMEGVAPEDALRWAGAMANAVASTMDEATLDDVSLLFDDMKVDIL